MTATAESHRPLRRTDRRDASPLASYHGAELLPEVFDSRPFAPVAATHHNVGILAIVLDGDCSRSRQYAPSTYLPRIDDPAVHGDAGGRYGFEVRRVRGVWNSRPYQSNFLHSSGFPLTPTGQAQR
jgi:hypothetical protein